MKTETEIGVAQPQAKEHVEPPEAERGKRGWYPGAFLWRELVSADTLISDFWPLEL